jgi:hypothetical protein
LVLMTAITDLAANTSQTAESIANSPWSKEALFGLLAILFAILVPAFAFLGQYIYCSWRSRRTPKLKGKEINGAKTSKADNDGQMLNSVQPQAPGSRDSLQDEVDA